MQNLRLALSFGGILNSEELDEILLHVQARHLKAGEDFVGIGKLSTEIGFINSGIIRSYIVNEDNEDATRYFMRPKQFIMDIESYYNNTPSEAGLQALVDSEVYVIRHAAWSKLSESIPKLYILTKSLSEATLLNKIKDNDFLNFG